MPVLCTMHNSNPEDLRPCFVHFLVLSAMLRIHQSSLWSFLNMENVLSNLGRSKGITNTTAARSLWVIASFRFCSIPIRDQLPMRWLLTSKCSNRSTYQIFLLQASVWTVWCPMLFGRTYTDWLTKTSLKEVTTTLFCFIQGTKLFPSILLRFLLTG